MKRYSAWGHDGSFRFKWQAKRWERRNKKNEVIVLLESIASSLKVLEDTIDTKNKYGNTIKTVLATRY